MAKHILKASSFPNKDRDGFSNCPCKSAGKPTVHPCPLQAMVFFKLLSLSFLVGIHGAGGQAHHNSNLTRSSIPSINFSHTESVLRLAYKDVLSSFSSKQSDTPQLH